MQNDHKILLIARASKNIGGIATGGISKHVEDLSKMLLQNGNQPFIWDFTINRSYIKDGIRVLAPTRLEKFCGILYSIFCLNLFFSKKYAFFSLRDKLIIAPQTKRLEHYIREFNFKTVHVHSLNRPILSFLREAFPFLHIVATDHGFWQNPRISTNQENRVLKKIIRHIEITNSVIIISKYAAEKFKEYGLSTQKNIMIPNPVRMSELPFLNHKKEAIFFNGFNATMTIKNLPGFIEALRSDPFFKNYSHIAIVDKKGRRFLKNLDFEIEILGAQKWKEMVQIYNKSKILVMPSKSESFGLAYLEAIAVGTPVVGFHKTISEFEETLQLDIGEKYNPEKETPKDLAAKIKKVLLKDYDVEEMRGKLRKNYAWESKIKDFIELYQFGK